MKTKMKLWFYAFALVGSAIIILSSCKKDNDNGDDNNNGQQNVPVLSTTEVTEISHRTATSGGIITDDNGATVTARGVCWSTSQTPTINDSKTEDGVSAGSFISSITGLAPETTYYVRAYATNSGGTGYGSTMSFTTLEEIKDADGNVYSTVVIGNHEWFAENLRTTKYRNGSNITNVTDNAVWAGLSTPAYCWYNDDQPTYGNFYGALYNWYAVETGNLCPTGWRVPTDAEWTTLTNYAGGANFAGGKLKSTLTTPDAHPRWDSPNTGATDEYGFSAFPGGYRSSYDGTFDNVGLVGYWWSSNELDASAAWRTTMYHSSEQMIRHSINKQIGFSVRCLRDN